MKEPEDIMLSEKNYAKWNKPDTKEQKLYDSTYMRSWEQANS